MNSIIKEVKDSTLAYRTGYPTPEVMEAARVNGLYFYYSRGNNSLVFAEELRTAQIAAKRS